MSDDIEMQARSMGWLPQEEYKGDPERWRPADEFVRRGQEVLPIMKKNNERLLAELQKVKMENAQTRKDLQGAIEALKAFKEYHDADSKRQYERARADLLSGKKEALREGDTDRVVEIDEALSKLDKAADAVQDSIKIPEVRDTPVEPQIDPAMQRWISENADWFQKDMDKTNFAMAAAQYVRAANPGVVGYDFLELVKAEVERKFGETKPTRHDKVDGARGSAGTGGNGRSYKDLPPEAKAACDRFASRLVGTGPGQFKTVKEWQEKYCQDYFGEQ